MDNGLEEGGKKAVLQRKKNKFRKLEHFYTGEKILNVHV